uniref:Perilipin 1 n=2 Tax=Nothobranchius furzeri TaxID=105023 RepID=A0A8C6KDG2_NOTFU
MPSNNNNQKVAPSAIDRITKLPVVRSACSTLSDLYKGTKCNHSNLKFLCEALESRMTALSTAAYTRISPALGKLEPQISIANSVACKGLDWLETSFPVLFDLFTQVVVTAKNKIIEIQDVVSIAASGTIDCVQHTVTWVKGRVLLADDGLSLVDRAIGVAAVGLDSALTLSEALMDHVLPQTEDEEKQAHLVEGFETATHGRSYSVRMSNLTGKLCRRTYYAVGSKIPSFQVSTLQNTWSDSALGATSTNNLSFTLKMSTHLVQDLHTSCWTLALSIQGLPQYLQHQAGSMFVFIAHLYNLGFQSQGRRSQGPRRRGAAEAFPTKELGRLQNMPTFRMRPFGLCRSNARINWFGVYMG